MASQRPEVCSSGQIDGRVEAGPDPASRGGVPALNCSGQKLTVVQLRITSTGSPVWIQSLSQECGSHRKKAGEDSWAGLGWQRTSQDS